MSTNNWYYAALEELETEDLKEIIEQCKRTDGTMTEILGWVMLRIIKETAEKIVKDRND